MDVINCPKCGSPYQQLMFLGIEKDFVGGIEVPDKYWLVCTNPECEDGKFNVNLQSPEEMSL